MNADDTASFIYLSLLLGAIAFYYVIANRRHLSKMIRHAVLWALIFIGVLAGVGLWEDVHPRLITPAQITHGDGVIEVPKDRRGQFNVVAKANGVNVEFLIDTGASNVVLSMEDAKSIGVDIESLTFLGSAQTANGEVRIAPTYIDTFNLGGVQDDGLKVYVTDGDLFGSLLGMDYLRRFEKIEIARDTLVLTR